MPLKNMVRKNFCCEIHEALFFGMMCEGIDDILFVAIVKLDIAIFYHRWKERLECVCSLIVCCSNIVYEKDIYSDIKLLLVLLLLLPYV